MSLRIYGNRPLKTLPGNETRPTLAKVREAVFNRWQGRVVGCRWLDLCAGSGAMGAEALCRGAAVVIGVERSPRACQVIQQNWQQVATPEQSFQVICGDVLKTLSRTAEQAFDLIYFDPPYASELYTPVLGAIAQFNWLAATGELAVEHAPQVELGLPPNLTIERQKVYGNTGLSFLGWSSLD
jgi:16S rRNA (guanine966-N2)-methyltransferase